MHNLLFRAIYEDKEVVVDGNMVSDEMYHIYLRITTPIIDVNNMVVTYDIK